MNYMKCPSIHCKKEIEAESKYCPFCKLDLSLDKEEIESRDELMYYFKLYFEEKGLKQFDMSLLHRLLERHGAKLFLLTIDIAKDIKQDKKSPEIKLNGLYKIFFDKLQRISKDDKGYISFDTATDILCKEFSISKLECNDILMIYRDFGLLEINKDKELRLLNE